MATLHSKEDVETVSLMGIELSAVTEEALVAELVACSLNGDGGSVLTPNLDAMRLSWKYAETNELVRSADIRVADGMPLVWMSKLQRTPLPARVAGSDLIISLSAAAADAGLSVFLLGGDPGTAEAAADHLRKLSPTLKIAGTHCPPVGYEHDAAELQLLFSALEAAQPDFVYVGLPFAKAAALAQEISGAFPTSWTLGLGVSFSFMSGDVKRAPLWMQAAGLEWLHRLFQEPGRLFRRYILEDLPFLPFFCAASLQTRHRNRARELPATTEEPPAIWDRVEQKLRPH